MKNIIKILKAIIGVIVITHIIPVLGGVITIVLGKTFLTGYLTGLRIMIVLCILVLVVALIIILGALVLEFIRWCFGYPIIPGGIIDKGKVSCRYIRMRFFYSRKK